MNSYSILMYHNIATPPTHKRLSSLYTSPKQFHRQMWFLSKLGYRGLSLKELYPYLIGEKTGKVFGISFDDGYLDNLENALPILSRFGFTATCYLVSEFLGKTNLWTYNQNVQEAALMSPSQVHTWLAKGMSIGSHSQTHAHLPHLSEEALKREICDSKTFLEQMFDVPIDDFCFPYGEYNQNSLNILKASSYKTALTTERGRWSKGISLFQIPRVHMAKRTSIPLLFLKMFTKYEDKRKRVFIS